MDYNKQFKKGIQDIKKTSLSETEKGSMLARLTEYTVLNPVSDCPRNILSSVFFQIRQFKSAYAFAVLALLIIVGGNISYAAAQSLPGDLLYPIKIHVNEKIQGVLKVTPKATAKWEQKKIENRLDEVKTLVEKGEFDTKKREQVEKEVKKNVDIIRNQKNKDRDPHFSETIDTKFKRINEIKEDNQKEEVKHLEQKIQDELEVFKKREVKYNFKNEKFEKENHSDQSKHQR